MTETVRGVSAMPKEAKKRTSSSTASARERAAIAELVRAARERGDDITGPDGLLKSITATVLEAALEEEMTDHLGHPKHKAPDGGAGNIRNGTRGKTVLTDAAGEVTIEVPRDCASLPSLGTGGGARCPRCQRLMDGRSTEVARPMPLRADHLPATARKVWAARRNDLRLSFERSSDSVEY